MLRPYEMLYILRPDMIEEQVKQHVTRYNEFLAKYDVKKLTTKIWGKRRLAYPIQKFQDGIYVQLNYEADGTQVAPLEREMRLSEEVIRFLTVRLEEKKPEKAKTEAVPTEAAAVATEG
ncbi:MAG: 30S ribosomal protein S6 [Microcystaceae cyanobacterium]